MPEAETLLEVAGQFRGHPGIARLRGRAARRRRRLSGVAREAIATPRLQRLLLALGAYFATLDRAPGDASVPVRARDWIGPVLQQRHDKLVKRARHIHRVSASDRHRARVAAKKMRYAAEFFAPLFADKRRKAYIGALSKLQSILGRLNDLEVAGKLLDELAPAEDPAAVEDYFKLGYRGARFSFGYGACPNLEDRTKMMALLEPERIGVSLSEELQLHPEQSTDAFVLHHPEAKYFNV